jgi:hypothetical protein
MDASSVPNITGGMISTPHMTFQPCGWRYPVETMGIP